MVKCDAPQLYVVISVDMVSLILQKVKFTLEQTMKAQMRSRGTALLFL